MGDLTYIKHYPSSRPCAFGNVDGAIVQRVGDDGEDFGGKADWVAMSIRRLLGSSGIQLKRRAWRLLVKLDEKLKRGS